ncbi:glycerate kinase type-2 family protein [Deferrisoma palaeochoriense]
MAANAGEGGPGGTPAAADGADRLRQDALAVFRAAVGAADPEAAVVAHLRRRGDDLEVGPEPEPVARLRLHEAGKVWVVGAGKGSAPMAAAVETVLGDRIAGGVVCVKDGHGLPLGRIEVLEASHPVPDARGVEAGRRILELVRGAGPDDLVVAVLSGGGSALLSLPAPGVTLEDVQEVTRLLLASGATIGELNAVRKHLSQVKGGRLGAAAHPARVVNLVLSDVIGDRLDVIASGPFSPDPTTFSEARQVLVRRGVWDRVPEAVRRHIEAGCRGEVEDTPKPGDPRLAGIVHVVVGSNRKSLEAAAARARALGYNPLILTSRLEGEAREVGRALVAVAQEARERGDPVAPPACLLAGGETTVTLRGSGKGGRNQEMALAMALALEGWEGIAALSGGTDGTDGPTDAAGGLVDGTTAARARASGLEPAEFLDRNDSYALLRQVGDLLVTGPTRTNVMDVQVLLVAAPQD